MTDQTLICCDCKGEFIFTARDQEFFAAQGYTPPRRCRTCRDQKKARMNGQGDRQQGQFRQNGQGQQTALNSGRTNQGQMSQDRPQVRSEPRTAAMQDGPIIQYRNNAKPFQAPAAKNNDKERRRDAYGERQGRRRRKGWDEAYDD